MDELTDLRDRLTEVSIRLADLAANARVDSERSRLYGKAQGIRVARSYVDEVLRTTAHLTTADQADGEVAGE